MEHDQNDSRYLMPMVSVIIPVFRAEKYLARCMDSLFRQSFHQFEIILIDDGSDDSSPTLCDQYEARDRRVIVIHQKNQGTAAARNAGLLSAKGEFVAFVDPDDWVHKDFLQVLVQQIGDAMVCSCGHHVIREYVEDVKLEKIDRVICTGQQALGRDDCRIYIWGKLYRRNNITTIRFDTQLKYAEDRVFNATLLASHPGNNCVIIQNPLYYYYQHASAITKNSNFTDLPAVGEMISISATTSCAPLLEYLTVWLCTKRQTGFHIGNPPDYETVDKYLKQCADLIDGIIPQKRLRLRYRMMIFAPGAYRWLSRFRHIVSRIIQLVG